ASLLVLLALAARDFTLAYVEGRISRDLPLGYRLTSFWSGQEGSLLLWLTVLAAAGALMVRSLRRAAVPAALLAHATGVVLAIATFFALLVALVAGLVIGSRRSSGPSDIGTASGGGTDVLERDTEVLESPEAPPAEPEVEAPPAEPDVEAPPLGLGERFRLRLSRTRNVLGSSVADLFGRGVSDEAWEGLEEALITADVGVTATTEIVEELRRRAREEGVTSGEQVVELYFPGAAHTADNIIAWFPGAKVLFGGCMVKSQHSGSLGFVGDADKRAWPQSLQNALARYPEAEQVVPGHGLPGDTDLVTHTLELLGH
ncbi:MAG: signal recognition particle receptor subunit alpha, partial [Proteobacteria bacterium]|nr:signal recognition particle receptor subunit alpha [Pseudomonadota bacterium]